MEAQFDAKFRFWDTVDKQFFKSVYKPAGTTNTLEIRELLVSQNGEIFLHEEKAGCVTLIHQKNFDLPIDQDDVNPRYLKDLYSGVRDIKGKKYYFNDIVCFTDKQGQKSWGVLVWEHGSLSIGSGPIGNYHAIDSINKYELAATECVGNIYQDRHLIMGDEGPVES